MATQKKTAEVDYSMQEKILALYDLQKIDSQIDSINKVKRSEERRVGKEC